MPRKIKAKSVKLTIDYICPVNKTEMVLTYENIDIECAVDGMFRDYAYVTINCPSCGKPHIIKISF
ncbi:MAG TPA: hypothetical protein VK172_10380 [Lentimicrobium sp.]|nr:hypothetical protein [Lentimicrobium sp.]